MGYRVLEHTADLGIEARGRSLGEALDQAIAGLGSVLTGEPRGTAAERRGLSLTADDPESLVVALLTECLFLFEVEGWVARGASLTVIEGAANGQLLGEPWDPDRHDGLAIKAITWHQLAVVQQPEAVTITVYLDA